MVVVRQLTSECSSHSPEFGAVSAPSRTGGSPLSTTKPLASTRWVCSAPVNSLTIERVFSPPSHLFVRRKLNLAISESAFTAPITWNSAETSRPFTRLGRLICAVAEDMFPTSNTWLHVRGEIQRTDNSLRAEDSAY